MEGNKVLVLGGTGSAGICLLRELAFHKRATVAYARNISKIPTDLASNEFLEIVQGEMSDGDALSRAVAKCSIVLSLLGPNIMDRMENQSLYADIYKDNVFPLMRKHGVRRILAMGTLSIQRPEDSWTFFQPMVLFFVRMMANGVYRNIINLANTFEHDAADLDWTIFRIAAIPGNSDEMSWKQDREDGGEPFVGWIGEKGWTSSIRRAALARWLVDAADGKADSWIGKMPAISRSGLS
ncbi:NAD(P)-binding protein [Xylariaceae sp. AK1471]|nr:NAD(P)-binding protein [Xylariaceae sp. AK1471]